jgi:translocation and assembly module TamB
VSKRKKIGLWLGLPAAMLVLLGVALPLWWPWVLPPLARAQGAHYNGYQRIGYARFLLTGFSYTNATTEVRATRVEADVPTVWLWRLELGNRRSAVPFLRVDDWQYRSAATPATAQETRTNSTEAEVRYLSSQLRHLSRWLPRAALYHGRVRDGTLDLTVPSATWANRRVDAQVVWGKSLPAVNLELDLNQAPYTLQLHAHSVQANAAFQLAPETNGLSVAGALSWMSNRVDVQARFATTGWLPENAHAQARQLRVPARTLKLPGYKDVTGALTVDWQAGNFSLAANALATPPLVSSNLPPLALKLRASGDTNGATISEAIVSAPWLKVELSRDVTLHWTGPWLREPAAFHVQVDLAQQAMVALRGALDGDARIEPDGKQVPAVTFHLSGTDLQRGTIVARTARLDGQLSWPRLEIRQAGLGFEGGSTARASGTVQLADNRVEAGLVEFKGPLVRRWLPAGYNLENLSLSARFAGPFAELTHTGGLDATQFTAPGLQPLRVQADWSGRQLDLDTLDVKASAGTSRVEAQGALRIRPKQLDLHLVHLSLISNGSPAMALTQPCRLLFQSGLPAGGWSLTTTPIEWAGAAGRLSANARLDWPYQGTFEISASSLSTALAQPFLQAPVPQVQVKHLAAAAGWTNGPAQFHLQLDALEGAMGQEPLAAAVSVSGDAGGLVISNLILGSASVPAISVHGMLPLTFAPAEPGKLVQWQADGALRVDATAGSQAAFWNELARLTGVTLNQPNLQMALSGTWEAPEGSVALSAQSLQLDSAKTNWPAMRNMRLRLELNGKRARLTQGELFVQGQRVSLTGDWPLAPHFFTALREKKLPDWSQASAQLRIEHAELAAFAPLFPTVLAPQGSLDVDLQLRPGRRLAGQLSLEGARTRPLGQFGPIRDIAIAMKFEDHLLRLERASASLSGAPVELRGTFDLRGSEWLHGRIPPFDLQLLAKDVPLARQPEFIVRSDLRLQVTKTNAAPPLISGVAHLRDSYYLSDLRALVPGRIAGPSRRPPYFSVEDPAVADWRLAVTVDGVRFLKVRSPLFNGELTANLKLQGTLKDPIALGDLRIDSGTVRFPFASLQVQQGLVSLTSQNPYQPQMALTAASKQFGYDIRMEVTGTADTPVIQFTSTPPLSSDQILLMVTAGQLPQGTFTLTPEQRAQTLALFLGRDMLAKLGFGDQSQERLTVRSGEEITEQGRPTYHIEYKLSKRWSLVGDYDRFGDFNGFFKWRVYSR